MKANQYTDRLAAIEKNLADFIEYDSIAALENVIVEAAIIIALVRGEVKEVE